MHLNADSLTGNNPVARLARCGGAPILERQVRDWCGRADTTVKVTPVVDLANHIAVGQYEVPDRLKQQIQWRDNTCVFPHCHRPATSCDLGHIEPYDAGGPTSTHNLAPLCRRHHRLKTHAGWSYQRTGPTSYLWTSPDGHQHHRDHLGTTEIQRPPPSTPLTRTG